MRKRSRHSDEASYEESSSYDSESEEEFFVRRTPRRLRKRTKYEEMGKVVYELIQDRLNQYYTLPSQVDEKDIIAIIENEEPTVERILGTSLLIEEKKRLVELLNIYLDEDTNALVKLKIKQEIWSSIGQKGLVTDRNAFHDDELASLRHAQVDKIPSLSNITKAFLTKEEKLKCLDMYDLLMDVDCDPKEKLLFAKKIHNTLASQLASQEEVNQMEHQEASLPHITQTNMKKNILALHTSPKNKKVLLTLNASGDDENNLKLSWYLKLPYQKIAISNTNLDDIYTKLNTKIHGMQEAKEDVMRFIHDKQKGVGSSSIIALEGSPGVGKTCFASNIAAAINVPFFKINLGGMTDATIFKGSEKVWKGSSPSHILHYLCQAGVSDVLILLDEVDKIGETHRGKEVYQSLLHILDPSQNREFQDLYLSDIPHDLSRVWFVLSMNDSSCLDAALKDRIKIIKLKDYSNKEKKEIITKHSIPSIFRDKGILPTQIKIDDAAIDYCLELCVGEGGMRSSEHIFNEVISKVSLYNAASENLRASLTFKLPNFISYPYKITKETIMEICAPKPKKVLSYYS